MIYAVSIGVVIALLVSITIYKSAAVSNASDFLVAGRSLQWPVLVFTLLSSWIGAGSLLAGAENAYQNGFVALWQPLGGWIGLLIVSIIAGRARKFAQFTIPDLLEFRYNVVARVFATFAIVISYTIIASYQMIGGGDIVHLIFPEVSRLTGLYIVAAFAIFFTATAGMASVAYLDLAIGSIVTGAVLVSVPVALARAGGWHHVFEALPPSHFTFNGTLPITARLGLMLPTLLLLIGNQGMYQKFFSARSESDARKSVAGWIVGTTVIETLLIALAVIASSVLRTPHPREILPLAAKQILPSWLGAVLLSGIFAKVISTANNFLFSPATNIIHDVYQRFINKTASQNRVLLVSRLTVVVLGCFAILQATQFESVLKASLYAYTIYGAAVTPCVMAVFFWPQATTRGAIASIASGTVTTITWELVQQYASSGSMTWMRDVDAVFPALAISVISLVAVSLADQQGRTRAEARAGLS